LASTGPGQKTRGLSFWNPEKLTQDRNAGGRNALGGKPKQA